jgi:GH18 family chitinase
LSTFEKSVKQICCNILEEVKHLMNLKQKNPNLKVLASMGGWNEGSTKYSHVAADPEKRATMVQSVLKYMEKHGFDGLDLDWEYPGQCGGDPENDPVMINNKEISNIFDTFLDQFRDTFGRVENCSKREGIHSKRSGHGR